MIRRRLAGVLGALAIAVGAATATTTPAAADAAGDCLADGFVWVIVQSPNGTRAGCATSFGNGEAALRSAGHSISHNSSGLICRINGYPADCPESPMSYWAYFHAPAGGAWSYSNFGAANRTPGAGTVDGWRYGDGAAPNTRPPAKSVPQPTTQAPKPTTQAPKPPKPTTQAPKPPGPTTQAPKPPATRAAEPTTRAPAEATRAPRSEPKAPARTGGPRPTSRAPRGASEPARTGTPTGTPRASTGSSAQASPTPGSTTPPASPSPGAVSPDPSGAPSSAPGGEPMATIAEQDSPNGLLVTAGVVGLATAGTTGVLLLRRRGGAG